MSIIRNAHACTFLFSISLSLPLNATEGHQSDPSQDSNEPRQAQGVKADPVEDFVVTDQMKSPIYENSEEAGAWAKQKCEEYAVPDKEGETRIDSATGVRDRTINLFWTRDRKSFWRSHRNAKFPTHLITLNDEKREAAIRCLEVDFKAFHFTESGTQEDTKIKPEEALFGTVILPIGMLMFFDRVANGRELEVGEHRGHVVIQASCAKERPIAQQEALRRLEACYVETEALFREAGLISKSEDPAGRSQAINLAKDKAGKCDAQATRLRKTLNPEDTVFNFPKKGENICQKIDMADLVQ